METIIVPAQVPVIAMAPVNFPVLGLAQLAPKVEVIALEKRKRRRH